MAKPAMGAMVKYCGHEGSFVADIFKIDNMNVVRANGPVTPANLYRGLECTHHLVDFPKAGFWCPERGVFVVPAKQVREL